MFGKGKLLSNGAEAQGVVIESIGSDLAQGGIADRYKVKLRVQFDDGSTAEVSGRLHRHEDGWHIEGDILPVRYDPADRSKIVIDEPALKARHEANTRAAKELAVAQGERNLARGGPAPSSGSAMELAGGDPELAELHEFEATAGEAGVAPAATSPSGSQTRLDRLTQLADLRDRGVLSDDELAAEKAKILSET